MLAVIKVRGNISVSPEIKRTMELLNLTRINHMVLVSEKPQMKKMVEKIQGHVTFGEINKEILVKVLQKKGQISSTKKLTEKELKEMKIKDFNELAEQLISEKITLKKLGIKPVFRLKAPRKGYGRAGIKKPFKIGGALGYRAKAINELIKKMV
jgi:large subunit ribosomal protein L30